MIEFHELIPDVWSYPRAGGGEKGGVIVGERAVLLVDPGGGDMGQRAVTGFIEANAPGREVRIAIFTGSRSGEPDEWPGAHILSPGRPRNGVSLPDLMPGWEITPLGEAGGSKIAVYNRRARILFCGDMLPDPQVGIPRLSGGSQSYLDALTQVEGIDVKLAVPLRGAPAQGKRAVRSRIEGDRNYVLSLLRHILTTQSASVPLERAVSVASEIYDSFPYLQDHLDNLRAVWAELA
jgi:hypothetical protein